MYSLIPHSHRYGYVLVLTTQKCLCPEIRIFAMALNGFSVLLFVPSAPEVVAEIKELFTVHWFYLLILRLELLHNAIKNDIYYDTFIIFQIRKESELTGQKS